MTLCNRIAASLGYAVIAFTSISVIRHALFVGRLAL